ncbi:MFS transporter [Virgisporangium aurantiacum]|uniref:MFS transporter n=1 Tax=Virgisporangium aurantiacum TaxID=175570 RepID=A0A8J3ZKX5_9ACTN|nr:MFS transporter [Virgisporangium aurantiacum]GIJ63368.1 MFS transporter [Virgisporangium aurantiacum]
MSGSPLREPRFRRFIVGHGISLLGDQFYFTALLWVSLRATGSATTAGFVLTTATLPRALLMLAGGVLVDRAGSRRVILVADVIRAAVMVTAAVAAGTGAFGVVALFAVAAVFGVVDAAVHPATGAIIPRLVEADALTAANGIRMMVLRLSSVLVPPVAGVLLAAGRVGWLFLANAATFVASFLAVRSIGLPPPARGSKPRRFLADLLVGLRYAARQPVLATLLPVSAVVAATFGVLTNAGLPLLAHRNGWGAAGFGLLVGGFGAGAVAGSGVHGLRLWRRPFTGGLILACMATQAGFFAVMPMVRVLAPAVAMQVAIGFLTGFTGGPLVSLVQAAATEETLGRVMSLHSLTVVGFVPIAFGVGGILADAAGVAALFVGGAAVEAAACIVGMLFTPVRTATPQSLSPGKVSVSLK